MARQVNKLTDRSARNLQIPGYHGDGNGLYLQVTRGGSRSWIFRFKLRGRCRDMGLGSLLDVSLADARALCREAKRTLALGIDPIERRRIETAAASRKAMEALGLALGPAAGTKRKFWMLPPSAEELGLEHRPRLATDETGNRPAPGSAILRAPQITEAGPSLLDCWTEYVAAQEERWRGRKTKDAWMRSVEKHAALIKNKPVAAIDVDDVLSVLRPLWMTKSESAGKLRERLERVLDYARVMKLRQGENPALWKGHLAYVLPPRPKLQRGHMPAVPYVRVPALMQELARRDGISARALEFTILTAARETMTLEATWSEIQDDVWELGAHRMKERPFRQPLSTGALAVLEKVRPVQPRAAQLIFPSQKGGVLSNQAMDVLLREIAPPYTPHGMRSSFRDWAGDETEFPRDVIEECLAHVVGDETERAYRRSDALAKRRRVLEAWSAYCLGSASSRTLVSMSRAPTGAVKAPLALRVESPDV